MLNLFKTAQTTTLEKHEQTTGEIIEQIHNEFNNAGEELLRDAQALLAEIAKKDLTKGNSLLKFGFSQAQETLEHKELLSQKATAQQVANAVMMARREYQFNKFITHDKAIEICEKYNLYIGDTSQYKGFVPRKNLEEIEAFSAKYDLNDYYVLNEKELREDLSTRWNRDTYTKLRITHSKKITKEQYENFPRPINWNEKYPVVDPIPLKIAAPLKDMDTTGYEVKGRELKKHIPDPIVMIPRTYNGIDGYIIITAWGDEASDPEIIDYNK